MCVAGHCDHMQSRPGAVMDTDLRCLTARPESLTRVTVPGYVSWLLCRLHVAELGRSFTVVQLSPGYLRATRRPGAAGRATH